jgi:hypothetical protein
MTSIPRLKIIMLFAILLIFIAFTAYIDARGRGGGGRSFSRSGAASHGSVKSTGSRRTDTRSDRGDRKSDARSDRSDRRDDARDDRSDRRDDVRDDRRDYRDDVRDDRRDYYEDRRRLRAGTFLTVTAFRALTCNVETIVVAGVTYYRCDSVWYSSSYDGGEVVYVIVTAPSGY